ncbi:MAG: sugar ABC transporter permease [Ardenticatenales bacterium]|nr:sugar ABC transporter permease [Ardenticatenales bacterium]
MNSRASHFGLILAYVGPTLLGVFLFSVLPILYNVFLSFTNRNQFNFKQCPEGIFFDSCPSDGYVWVGLEQYQTLLSDLVTREVLGSLVWFLVLGGLFYIAYRFLSRYIDQNTTMHGATVGFLGALALSAALWQALPMGAATTRIAESGDFFVVMARTTLWTAVCVSLFFLVGLTLALILNSDYVRFKGFWRTMIILPWAVPYYISALTWKFFFNGEFGTINNILRLMGWENPPSWLTDPTLAFAALVVINLWMSFPFFTTIILGALQSIPKEMYEASEVDGANFWQQLLNVTLPLIRPAVVPAMVLSALTTFKLFESVWMVTKGGPQIGGRTGATEIVMVFIYNQAFQKFNYGYISAFAVILFIILFAVTIWQMRLTKLTEQGAR